MEQSGAFFEPSIRRLRHAWLVFTAPIRQRPSGGRSGYDNALFFQRRYGMLELTQNLPIGGQGFLLVP